MKADGANDSPTIWGHFSLLLENLLLPQVVHRVENERRSQIVSQSSKRSSTDFRQLEDSHQPPPLLAALVDSSNATTGGVFLDPSVTTGTTTVGTTAMKKLLLPAATLSSPAPTAAASLKASSQTEITTVATDPMKFQEQHPRVASGSGSAPMDAVFPPASGTMVTTTAVT